ncbi:MAG: endonuclease/exonuclease/phosphatase family protein [Alphaproteobacteria bacterium]
MSEGKGLRAFGIRLSALGAAVLSLLGTEPARAGDDTLRIATWNIANLHHMAGESVPGRDVVRSKEDYVWLRHYAYKLGADIVALQEINSRAAAHRIFGRGGWTVHISGRKALDMADYDLTGKWSEGSIYTGFAVRKNVNVVGVRDVRSLEVDHLDPRTGLTRKTRWAMELEVEKGGQRLVLLAVHLKSGCFTGTLKSDTEGYDRFVNERDADCTTAARQVGPLRAWIETKLDDQVPFVILGDFNRAFDIKGEDDHLWQGLTDGLPRGATLTRFPNGQDATCWKNAPPAPYHRFPIDHLLFSPGAARLAKPDTFGWLTFDASLATKYGRISDHCPAHIDLDWSGAPAAGGAMPDSAQEAAAPLAGAAARLVRVDVGEALAVGLAPLNLTGPR